MKIVVTGAGVGGLVLTQGLLKAGHEVVTVERGREPSGPSGYRMRMDSRACGVLAELLPAELYTALLASGAGKDVTRRLAYFDDQLRELGTARENDDDVLMIGRGPLRRLLAHGLGDRVRWRTEAASYTVGPDAVTVTMTDGSTETGDLVVVAEGVHSTLRRQLLGDSGNESMGVAAVCGRIPGTPAEHGLTGIAGAVAPGYVLASGANNLGIFLSAHDPSRGQAIDAAAVGPVPADVEDAYLVWGVAGPEDVMPDKEVKDPGELRRRAEALLGGWHEEFRRLPGLADPSSLERYLFNASTGTPIWATPAGTGVGDAIHTVPPTGGVGASTAVRDAGILVDALSDAHDRATILRSLHRYEQRMRQYADQVVTDSVAPLSWQNRIAHPAVHALATGALARAQAVRDAVVH